MDRFNAMQTFVRVVETGSFTKAAETLHISRTTATQLVQQLETHLRVKLLNRTTRRVKLTQDGAAYYERAVQLLTELDDVETSLGDSQTSPRGRLRVDVPSPLARMVLIPALPEFYARYPEIQLDMGVSDRRVDLAGEAVDCVVRGGELTDLSLVARRIGNLTLGAYAAPRYVQEFGVPAHPLELSGPAHYTVGFIWARTGKPLPYTMQREGERLKVQGRYRLSVDDGNAYLAAGLAGLGILWLPEYVAAEHLRRGELVTLFAEWHIDPMPLYVAFPPNRHLSAKLRAFIDWAVELLRDRVPLSDA